MEIKPIKRKSVSESVLEQMKDLIINGDWAPGDKIPGEIELAEMFQVSRISIRQAIHRLVGMGVLTIKRGQGTYVSEILPQDYFSSLLPILMIDRVSLDEMLEFRSILEVESARLAALRATEEDLRRMEKAIKAMERYEGDYAKFAKEDLNFHLAIARATHNSVIVKINDILHDLLKSAMEEIIQAMGFHWGIYYHKKITNAIRIRDGEAAAKLMKKHIDNTVEKVKKHNILDN